MTGEPTESTPSADDPLDRLLRLVEPHRVLDPPASVSRGCVGLSRGSWRLFAEVGASAEGEEIASFSLPSGQVVRATIDADSGAVSLPFSLPQAYHNYLFEVWKASETQRDLSPAQLNAFYRVKRFVPRSTQLAARRLRIRRHGLPSFPAWPFDPSVLRLLRFYVWCALWGSGRSEAAFDWFWPESYRAAIILTHDVETAAGLRLAVELADLEEEHGFRSSFNLGGWYDPDPGVVRELRSRGFEIGMHGLRHDRSLFASRQAFESALPELGKLAAVLGAEGFRSPATHRVTEWLNELPVLYDCSIPHSDPFEPQTGGCCSLWPFFLGDVVELPYTLPQDHALLTLLQHRSAKVWIAQAEKIERFCGLVQCISHPDPGYLGDSAKRSIYEEFLEAVADRDTLWVALPVEVARWWRRRDLGEAAVGQGLVRVGEEIDGIEFVPPAPGVCGTLESAVAYLPEPGVSVS